MAERGQLPSVLSARRQAADYCYPPIPSHFLLPVPVADCLESPQLVGLSNPRACRLGYPHLVLAPCCRWMARSPPAGRGTTTPRGRRRWRGAVASRRRSRSTTIRRVRERRRALGSPRGLVGASAAEARVWEEEPSWACSVAAWVRDDRPQEEAIDWSVDFLDGTLALSCRRVLV